MWVSQGDISPKKLSYIRFLYIKVTILDKNIHACTIYIKVISHLLNIIQAHIVSLLKLTRTYIILEI